MLKISAVNSQNLPSGVPGDFFQTLHMCLSAFRRWFVYFLLGGRDKQNPPSEVAVGVGVWGWGVLCGVSRRGEPHHPRAGGEGRVESAEDEPRTGRRGGES